MTRITIPPGQHLPTLRVWAEWRRRGLTDKQREGLARARAKRAAGNG